MSKETTSWLAALLRKIIGRSEKREQQAGRADDAPRCKSDSVWFSALIRKRRGIDGENELTIEHVAETPWYIARSLMAAQPACPTDECGRIRLQFPMQCAPDAMSKLRPDLNPGKTIQPEFTVRGPQPKPGTVNL